MKKIFWTLLAVICIGLSACDEEKIYFESDSLRISGTIAAPGDPKSRVMLVDNNATSISCLWEEGDTIGLITEDGSIDNVPCVASGSGASVSFIIPDDYDVELKDGTKVYAYYPYRKGSNEGTVVEMNNVAGYDVVHDRRLFDTGSGLIVPVSEDSITDLRGFLMASGTVAKNKLELNFQHTMTFIKIRVGNELLVSSSWGGLTVYLSQRYMLMEDLEKPYTIDLSTGEEKSGGDQNIEIYSGNFPVSQGEDGIIYLALATKNISDRTECFRISTPSGQSIVCHYPEGGFQPGVMYSYSIGQTDLDEQKERTISSLLAIRDKCGGDDFQDGKCDWSRSRPVNEWRGVYTMNLDSKNFFVTGLTLDHLSAPLPEELCNLTFLEELVVPNCGLPELDTHNIGPLPSGFSKLRNLKWVNLPWCDVEGNLIDYIPVIKPWMKLYLTHNKLTGPLPELSEDFEEVQLAHNDLTGPIPESWANYLDRIDIHSEKYKRRETGFDSDILGHNRLSGQIPQKIVNHRKFNSLILSLVQQEGYGFDPVPIKWSTDRMILKDGSVFDLGQSYSEHEYTLILNVAPNKVNSIFWYSMKELYHTYKDRGLQLIVTSQLSQWPSIIVFDVYGSYFEEGRKILGEDAVFIDPYSFEGSEHPGSNRPQEVFRAEPCIGLPTIDGDKRIPLTAWAATIIDRDGYYKGSYQNQCPLEDVSYNTFPLYMQPDLYTYVANLFGDDRYEPKSDGLFYTSTDYSADGEVVVLQEATVGKGVDLVFMGNGYVDLDMIPGGVYESDMTRACEALFSYEPYRSLRNRFNVYAVKAVSANREFAEGTSHALDDGPQNFVSIDKPLEYASRAPISGDPIVAVQYNSKYELARSYTAMFEDCAVAFNFTNDMTVMVHEYGGHAFGKLGDEYTESSGGVIIGSYEVIDEKEREGLLQLQKDLGWNLNVDVTGDPTKVRWSHFLSDKRYDAEGLGTYEGAYLYKSGVWRSSRESMMRGNNCGFNAPSREIIYKRVMEASEGPGWKYDFETFYRFDKDNIKMPSIGSRSRAGGDIKSSTRSPIVLRGSWRNHHTIPDDYKLKPQKSKKIK